MHRNPIPVSTELTEREIREKITPPTPAVQRGWCASVRNFPFEVVMAWPAASSGSRRRKRGLPKISYFQPPRLL